MASAQSPPLTEFRRTNREGCFRARSHQARPVEVCFGNEDDPFRYRRAIAFSRLASALHFEGPEVRVEQAIPLTELAAFFESEPHLSEWVRGQRLVQNNGCAFAAVGPAGDVAGGWVTLRQIPTAELDNDLQKARAITIALILDFLSANVLRGPVQYDEQSKRVHLDDNRSAFPENPDPVAVARQLAMLRELRKFPRDTIQKLEQLRPSLARSLFLEGSFGRWLLTPRQLIELDERRLSLTSLLRAKTITTSDDVVFTL